MIHGNAHRVVGACDHRVGQAVALRTHHERQARFGLQGRIVERNRPIGQRHGRRAEAQRLQLCHRIGRPSPRHEKHTAHRHAHRTAIERVAGRARKHHGIDAQSGGRTEDRADVGSVGHPVDHTHARRIAHHFRHRRFGTAAHGTKHTAREGVARELRQEFARTGIDGNVSATAEHIGCITREMPLLAEQREGFVARIERHVDHLRTFGDEHAPRGIDFAAQLRFGQGTVNLYAGIGQGFEMKDGHTGVFFAISC